MQFKVNLEDLIRINNSQHVLLGRLLERKEKGGENCDDLIQTVFALIEHMSAAIKKGMMNDES